MLATGKRKKPPVKKTISAKSNGQARSKILTSSDGGEIVLLDPRKIEVVEDLLTRRSHASKEDIERLAEDIRKNGQDTPIVVRLLENGTHQLVVGWTRLQACKAIQKKKAGFLIRAEVKQELSDEDAVKTGIRENMMRKDRSPVDDAFNQQKLREKYGYNDVQIAAVYHQTKSWVGHLKKIMTLEPSVLDKVHKGQLPVSAALDMADLAPAEQVQVSQAVESELEGDSKTPKTPGLRKKLARKRAAKTREKVRDIKAKKGSIAETVTDDLEVVEGKTKKRPGKTVVGRQTVARTLPEIRAFFELIAGERQASPLRKVAKVIILYISGKKTDKQLDALLRSYLTKAPPEAENGEAEESPAEE